MAEALLAIVIIVISSLLFHTIQIAGLVRLCIALFFHKCPDCFVKNALIYIDVSRICR